MDKRFDLLPKEMKQAILALQDLHNVPDEMALQAVLGTVNLAVQCHYDVDSAIYNTRPTSLFLVAMVPTGGLKSTIMREVSRGIELFKDEQKILLANDELRFKLQQKKYEQQEKQYLKEIEVDPYAELPIPPKPVETFNYLVSKGTLNGLIDILRNQSFLGLFSSEAGEFFNAHSFQKNNINGAIEMCASMTKMWDGDVIERVTGENKTHLWHRRVMMCFLLQTEVFEEILNNRVFSEQGFIHRLLLTQTASFDKLDWDLTPGSRERMAAKRQKLERFDKTVYSIIRQTQNRRSDRGFELAPAVITQSDDAYQILGDFRNANKNRAQEDLREYAGFAERLHEHAVRIAATLAVFDHFEQNLDKDNPEPFDLQIRGEHAVAAVDLIDFYCEQRRQLELGVQDLNPVHTTGSQRLIVWIREKAWTGTQRELSQIGPAWFRKLGRDQRIKMLQDLVSDDLLGAREITAANGHKTWQFSVATQAQSSNGVATDSTVI